MQKCIMGPELAWKNFKLGEELSISGTFIYNGLRKFHEAQIFQREYSDEIFELMYSLAIGFERLMKIAVVLLEDDPNVSQAQLEKSLITHSHHELLGRIKKHTKVVFGPNHNDFLTLLTNFYKSQRYGRFSLSSVYEYEEEITKLREYFEKYIKGSVDPLPISSGFKNNSGCCRFINRVVDKISVTLYEIIEQRASVLGIFTYELRYGSKAKSVFVRRVHIEHEDVLWKELLLFFMNSKGESDYLTFLRSIPPLEFDPGRISEYLACFGSNSDKAFIMDTLETLYEGIDVKERLETINIIGEDLYYSVGESIRDTLRKLILQEASSTEDDKRRIEGIEGKVM